MLALDYNIIVNQTSYYVEKSKGNISSIGKKPSFLKLVLSLMFGDSEKKAIKTFEYQLFMSGWLLSDVQKNYDNLLDKDWRTIIDMLNKGIKMNMEIQSKIEKDLKGYTANIELELINKEIEETISNFYSCLRLFKKATKKTVHEQPSDLAVNAANTSANTINTIYAH